MKRRVEALPSVAERIEAAEQAFVDYQAQQGLSVRHGGNRAFYAPGADMVQMPLREAFRSTEGYYSVLAHELTHSTGHERRLSRQFGKRFGDRAYAVEELVAELGAAMICGTLGIEAEPRDDHADYIASWLRVLKDDKRAVVSAAAHAQKAADLVLAQSAVEAEHELHEAA
jgi:antirestriction protein ArdC